MTIYIDSDFKCHVDGTGMRAIETDFFDGRCKEFIEGYRFVPEGEIWTRDDGEMFYGVMISPWRDYDTLALAQSAADTAEAKADEELAALIEEIYNGDLEMIEG